MSLILIYERVDTIPPPIETPTISFSLNKEKPYFSDINGIKHKCILKLPANTNLEGFNLKTQSNIYRCNEAKLHKHMPLALPCLIMSQVDFFALNSYDTNFQLSVNDYSLINVDSLNYIVSWKFNTNLLKIHGWVENNEIEDWAVQTFTLSNDNYIFSNEFKKSTNNNIIAQKIYMKTVDKKIVQNESYDPNDIWNNFYVKTDSTLYTAISPGTEFKKNLQLLTEQKKQTIKNLIETLQIEEIQMYYCINANLFIFDFNPYYFFKTIESLEDKKIHILDLLQSIISIDLGNCDYWSTIYNERFIPKTPNI